MKHNLLIVYTISLARPQHLAALPAIELAAARLLVGHAPESVLAESTTTEEFEAARAQGHLWVGLACDVPVGFAHVAVLEAGSAHLKEIDVLPGHGRRGIGARLVQAVCEWARNAGFEAVTLTTFREVPFNLPFYAKMGFAEVPANELSAALRAILANEAKRGLDPTKRVAMRRPVREITNE
jgi:GNAT superfamily N-acetyltransferase